MIVRMRTTYASPTGNCKAGDTIDLPDAEAQKLLKAGYAEPVKEIVIETAVVMPEKETATTRRGRPPKQEHKVGRPNGV
ncbi:MAG: hypothetical protein WC374_08265 [Phycisphaerae bacterium]|jgi:hypothetical protein